MCGRYASSRRPDEFVEEFRVGDVASSDDTAPPPPSWNVAPTDRVPVVLERRRRSAADEGRSGEVVRALRYVRWGLVPSWASDPKIGSRLINARAETLTEKPAFRKAFLSRRCLVPADGYFEWYVEAGSRVKQPFFLRPRDGSILAMAGLYEIWRDPAAAPDDPHAWLWSCAVITTTAEDELGHLHDRMPMVVERARYDAWLDPGGTEPDELGALLVPAVAGRLEAYPVSRDVGNVRNNGPHLVERLS